MSEHLKNLSDREILLLTCAEVQAMTKGHDDLKKWVLNVDRRVHGLETWRTYLAGATAAIIAVGAITMKVVFGLGK